MLPAFYRNLSTRAIILSLGLLFLLPPAYKICAYVAFRSHAISVNGTIIDSSRGRDMGGRPIVAYKDLQGNLYERKSKAKTHWFFERSVGETIKVFYDKGDPHKSIVDSNFHYIYLPVGFIAAGIYILFSLFRDHLSKKKEKILTVQPVFEI